MSAAWWLGCPGAALLEKVEMLPLPGLAGGVKDGLLLLLGLWRETVVLQAVPVPATTRREHPASRLSQFQSVFGLFSIFTYKNGGVVLVGGKGGFV
jgi:hypothetical protein